MGGGSKKFAPLNLNDIYGKKEVKSKLPTLITKEDQKELPRREMLVLTAQRPKMRKGKALIHSSSDPISRPPRPSKRRRVFVMHGQSRTRLELLFVRN